jgi:catechol 2,3-dioxygenase-like lactoylglutathione lyase family enzyme
MADFATPNLPSRDFDATAAFYGKLGFTVRWRGSYWMILERGSAMLEFFPYPDLDPAQSSFSCCIRLDDLDAFYQVCGGADIPEARTGRPRLNPPRTEEWGGRVAYMVDPDGSLIRLIQN